MMNTTCYRLVVCEKPSVARSIAAVLGAGRREDGFLSGGGYLVSWCFGHLAELSDADAYDEKYGKWRREDLPILPEEVFKGFLAAPVSGLLGERLPDEKRLFALHDLNKPLAGRQLHGRFCADRLCHASLSPFTTVLNGLPVNARGTNPYRFTQSVFTIWTQRE